MIRKQTLFLHSIIFSCLLLVGCVGSAGKKTKAKCGAGQTFDSLSRNCVGATIQDGPPIPTTTLATISERAAGGVATDYVLGYVDSEADLAFACSAYSDNVGLVRSLNYGGIKFTMINAFPDHTPATPQKIQIKFISDTVLSVGNEVVSGGIRSFDIRVNTGVTTSSDIVSAIALSASSLKTITSVQLVSLVDPFVPTNVFQQVNEIPCFCNAGVCSASLKPFEYFNVTDDGLTDFYYNLTDVDGVGNFGVSSLSITSVNQVPVISGGVTKTFDENDADIPQAEGGTNIATDFGAAVSDVTDGDATCGLCTWYIDSPATNGTVTITTPGSPAWTYVANTYNNTADSFSFYVIDPSGGRSLSHTVNITFNSVSSKPYDDGMTIAAFNEDSTSGAITLEYADPEGDVATGCAITYVDKVYQSSPCVCAAGVCTVTMSGYGHMTGSGSFKYTITNGAPAPTSNDIDAIVTLTGVNDSPFTFPRTTAVSTSSNASFNVEFDESTSHVPLAAGHSFELETAIDPDPNTFTYSIVDLPANGTLSNCLGLSGSGTSPDLSCKYEAYDGNNNGEGSKATGTYTSGGSVQFESSTSGTMGNKIVVNLIQSEIQGVNPEAWVEQTGSLWNVNILIEEGATRADDIETYINTSASDEIKALITASAVGVGTLTFTAAGSVTLTTGTAAADSFTYKTNDGTLDSNTTTVSINIVPQPDSPTLCEYSKFSDAPECGILGCIGSGTPIGVVTPTGTGLHYFDTTTGSCYESDLNEALLWKVVESYIADHSVNELDALVIDEVKIDEGGGDGDEDNDGLTITGVDSTNLILVPKGNISFDYAGAFIGIGSTASIAVGDGLNSADDEDFKITVTPQGGQTGTTTISMTIEDGTSDPRTVSFDLTVNATSAQHGGWVNLAGLGPKTNKFGQVRDDPYACSYSRDLCEGSGECTGTSAPLNNASFTPDDVDALYWNSQANTCYRIDQSALETTVQDNVYVSRKPAGSSIEYVIGSPLGVAVTGTAVTVTMPAGTSNAEILNLIRDDSAASALVEGRTLDYTGTPVAVGTTILSSFTEANWTTFQTYCNVTSSDIETGCTKVGGACIGTGDPDIIDPVGPPLVERETKKIYATKLNSFYFDVTNSQCYRSTAIGTADDWTEYTATGANTIAWNDFTVSGAGAITSYNVYRKIYSDDFDYDSPINRSGKITTASSIHTFVDNAENSHEAPVANTVYYYEVRPVINSLPTDTSATFKTARIMTPPNNKAFVHRWMVNKEMCEKMNQTPDTSANPPTFRCSYEGPGDTGAAAGSNFYDIGEDLIVGRYEAGCPYTDAPACVGETVDGACIGLGTPNNANGSNGNIYYDRTTGICFLRAAGVWGQYTGATAIANHDVAELPPLTNMSQAEANTFCDDASQDIAAIDVVGFQAGVSSGLPSRKQQMGYSMWDNDAKTDSEITTLETGLSINSTAKCNSSAASGYESSYSDIEVPDSNTFFTLPGTSSSNIRSVMTGSGSTSADTVTENCVSRFGVQDTVGNVAEWVKDRINCPDNNGFTCVGVDTSSAAALRLPSTNDDLQAGLGADAYDKFRFDGVLGPCVDSNSDDVCDAFLNNWTIDLENNKAGRFFIPMGLPAHTDFSIGNNPLSVVAPFAAEIGPTSGITASQLHDDVITANTQFVTLDDDACGAMATGGDYLSGIGGGVNNFSFTGCSEPALGYLKIGGIIIKNITSAAATITLSNPGIANLPIEIDNAGNNLVVQLATDSSGDIATTGSELVAAITGDSDAFCNETVNERQDIALTAVAASGSFVLSHQGNDTGTLAFNASAATIAAALNGLTHIAALGGGITVTNDATSGPIEVRFTGASGNIDWPDMTFKSNTLKDGGSASISLTVSEVTQGVTDDGGCTMGAYIIDADASNNLSPLAVTTLNTSTPLSKNANIGFRCVIPIPEASYNP